MTSRRPYALVDLCWMSLAPPFKYPSTRAFGTTGYREKDGPGGLFSVYVKLSAGQPGPNVCQQAKLYALADGMRDRLPDVGARLFLTAGATVVAECLARGRGEEEE